MELKSLCNEYAALLYENCGDAVTLYHLGLRSDVKLYVADDVFIIHAMLLNEPTVKRLLPPPMVFGGYRMDANTFRTLMMAVAPLARRINALRDVREMMLGKGIRVEDIRSSNVAVFGTLTGKRQALPTYAIVERARLRISQMAAHVPYQDPRGTITEEMEAMNKSGVSYSCLVPAYQTVRRFLIQKCGDYPKVDTMQRALAHMRNVRDLNKGQADMQAKASEMAAAIRAKIEEGAKLTWLIHEHRRAYNHIKHNTAVPKLEEMASALDYITNKQADAAAKYGDRVALGKTIVAFNILFSKGARVSWLATNYQTVYNHFSREGRLPRIGTLQAAYEFLEARLAATHKEIK